MKKIVTYSLEWKPQDLWVGVYWKRRYTSDTDGWTDVYICLLPCLPIHLYWHWQEARRGK